MLAMTSSLPSSCKKEEQSSICLPYGSPPIIRALARVISHSEFRMFSFQSLSFARILAPLFRCFRRIHPILEINSIFHAIVGLIVSLFAWRSGRDICGSDTVSDRGEGHPVDGRRAVCGQGGEMFLCRVSLVFG